MDQALPLPGLHDPETPLRNLLDIVLERFVALDLGIERIAFAHHEASTDLLATFVATEREESSDGQQACFEARPLALVPSLSRLREQKQGRVLNDLNQDLEPTSPHSRWLLAQGWRASLTLPLFEHNRLLGFLFIDSSRVGAFTPEALARLDPHLDLLLLRIGNHFRGIATLHGSLKLVLDMAGLRDRETATHLERVSLYSRLIALALEKQRRLPADFSENLHRFAALHDVGKVGIPDRILLKPGALSRDERAVMDSHVRIGMALIERVITAMNLEADPRIPLLRQVVAHHHERLDGSGYPEGLRGDEVSLAGRIVAVADIYDALTQARPYKPPFSEAHAEQALRALVAAGQLDGDCVDALLGNRDQRKAIRVGHPDPPPEVPWASPPGASPPPSIPPSAPG